MLMKLTPGPHGPSGRGLVDAAFVFHIFGKIINQYIINQYTQFWL